MRGSWRAARRLGGGRAGPSRRRLPPASSVFLSLLAVSPATSTPSPRLLHVSLTITLRQTVSTRSSCVIRCLPKHVAHVPKCTRLPLRFSLSGQRSYAYVMRAEEGEPGNEANQLVRSRSPKMHCILLVICRIQLAYVHSLYHTCSSVAAHIKGVTNMRNARCEEC